MKKRGGNKRLLHWILEVSSSSNLI